jgi:hypothetical protein
MINCLISLQIVFIAINKYLYLSLVNTKKSEKKTIVAVTSSYHIYHECYKYIYSSFY